MGRAAKVQSFFESAMTGFTEQLRRSLQMELYCIRHYGLYDHLRRRKIKNPGYLASLLGKLNYWLMLEPNNMFARQSYNELSQLYRQSI